MYETRSLLGGGGFLIPVLKNSLRKAIKIEKTDTLYTNRTKQSSLTY